MRNHFTPVLIVLCLVFTLAFGEVINGDRSILGIWDASGASKTLVMQTGTTDPANCDESQLFWDTDAADESQFRKCRSTDIWSGILTTTHYIQFNMGVSQAGTASGACSTPAANAPASTSVAGTNTIYATYAFDDGTDESIQCHFSLPPDWDLVIDEAIFRWRAASITMETVWGLQTACVAIGETGDPAYNTAQTVTDTVQGTTLQWNDATILTITVTGCAVNEELFIKPFRDADNGADDMTGDAELLWVRLKFGRDQ